MRGVSPLLLMSVLACRPEIPPAVMQECATSADCPEGLTCVRDVQPGYQAELFHTCQVPCDLDAECNFAGTYCHACETDVEVAFCDWYACK